MNRIEEMYADHPDAAGFARAYLDYLSELVKKLDPGPIAAFIQLLETQRQQQRQIFFMGNGGSAATASHFANDVGAGPRAWDNPYRAIALTDNVAMITAIGNDHGYEEIFIRQLQMLMKAGDAVVAISASGNSPNVVKAVKYANENGATTVGLTGFEGGELAKLAKIKIHVATAKGEYGPVEDLHMVVDHLVGAYLMMRNRRGP